MEQNLPGIPLFDETSARQLEAAYAARKRAGQKGMLSGGAGGDPVDEKKKKGQADGKPKAPLTADVALQKKALNAVAQQTTDKGLEAAIKRKTAYIRIIERYYANPMLARSLPPRPHFTVRHDERDILGFLNNIRATMNARGSDAMIRGGLAQVGYGAETVTMQLKINPLQWDLAGFGSWFANEETQALVEPEVSEFVAEWGDAFASPYWVRFTVKLSQAAAAYSAGRKEAHFRATPANETILKAADDL